ncbi:DUF4468 domain-containing protein [uncultured Hymenobacter sp.]|uniref:DUF4468 domain-containing protein n=1 Tax=uncultured Hymenobacter sp. TaxID=170016 RepID=UPI0035CBC228
MKKFYLSALLLFALAGSATAQKTKYAGYDRLPKDSTTHKVVYTAVVPVAGASKDELYNRGREWFARTFNDANRVLRMDDRTAGTLIGSGIITQPALEAFSSGNNYHFNLAVYVKDGRFKYELTDIEQKFRLGGKGQEFSNPLEFWATHKINKLNNHELEDADERIKALLASLEKAMAAKLEGTVKKDW